MVVVILEVMWGLRYQEQGARWFRINPRNHSGKRLIQMLGHQDFVVTNACPQQVASAKHRGTPSAEWLHANLRSLMMANTIDQVLVCGRVAEKTFMVNSYAMFCKLGISIVFMPHPAAKGWTRLGLDNAAQAVQIKRPWPIHLNMKGHP